MLSCVIAWAIGINPVIAVTVSGITNRYAFDEGSGTTAIDGVGGNNATLQAFGVGNSQWITGMFGGAVNYINEDAYVVTNSPLAAGSASQFSVSFWTRLNSRPNTNDSLLATPQGDNWISYNPTANSNGSGKRGIGLRSVREANDPLIGVWENYVVTYDRPSGNVTVYRDGALRDSGVVSLPSLSARWVFGHNQDPFNTNGSWHGALDEVQIYNRVLTASDVSILAARPPQPGISAHLVVPAHDYGSQDTGQFASASTTFFVNPTTTDWIAWNRFPDLRAVADSRPGELFLGTYTPEVDDFFNLKVTNPLGQTLTVAMDQNGVFGEPTGLQSMIDGNAATAPTVLRGNNVGSPNFFDESGGFNSLFTVAGNYTFDFSFRNIGGNANYPDVYLLVHSVPEPSTLCVVGIVIIFIGFLRICRSSHT
jgi:hypothetical protein